ncbi:MAG: hypothetical protein WAU45_05220 [Blastocatellia bacterium]
MTDEEANEFPKLFLGIMERTIPDGIVFPESLARRSLGSASDLVTAARITISEDPPATASEIYRVGEECALCGLVPPPSGVSRRRYTFTSQGTAEASASGSGHIVSAYLAA